MSDNWNRCDICGRFIAIEDFDRGAVRKCTQLDSEFGTETYETLCKKHAVTAIQVEI